jgi:histidine ammonia-lyase
MSMGAALKAQRALELARYVLAVEALCACQAIDFLAPLETSAPLARVHTRIRAAVPTLTEDRPPAPDVEAVAGLIASGAIEDAAGLAVK